MEVTGLEGMQLWLRKRKRSSLQVTALRYHYSTLPSKLALTSPSEKKHLHKKAQEQSKVINAVVSLFFAHPLETDSHTPREKML